jgi:hypothetical protein
MGSKKILNIKTDIFGIKWTGKGREYNSTTYSYDWDELKTEIVEINDDLSISSLFTSDRLQAISDIWVHFNYDRDENIFLITDAAYTNSTVYFIDRNGYELNSINLVGQTCQVLIIK